MQFDPMAFFDGFVDYLKRERASALAYLSVMWDATLAAIRCSIPAEDGTPRFTAFRPGALLACLRPE